MTEPADVTLRVVPCVGGYEILVTREDTGDLLDKRGPI